MPQLYCTLCSHKWVQPALSTWNCPSCEIGAAPTHVLDVTNQEIDELWSYLSPATTFKPKRAVHLDGHCGYFAGYDVDDLRTAIDLLVLVFDVVVVPELWKDIDEKDPLSLRFIEYYDHGALLPLDQGGITSIRHLRDFDIGLVKRVASRGVYISISEDAESGFDKGPSFYSARENMMKVLTYLDFMRSGWNRDDLYKRLRAKNLVESLSERLGAKGLITDLDGGITDHLVNYTNGALIMSQYLGLPLNLAGTPEEVLRWKLGVDANWTPKTEYQVLRQFTSLLRVPVPVKTKDVLTLRESLSGQELRRQLQLSCSNAQDAPEAVGTFRDEYTRILADLEERSRSFGDVSVAAVSGMFSTLGGILGDAVGAVVGGIGGTSVSVGTKEIFSRIYEATHKNWAYYFRRWGKTNTSDKGR